MGKTNERPTQDFLDEIAQAEQTIAQKEMELQELKIRNADKLAQREKEKAADKAAERKLRKITASEARAIAESSTATLKHIYKNIEEEAKENRVFIIWSFYAQDDAIISKVTEALKADGYTITDVELPEDCTDREIKISW